MLVKTKKNQHLYVLLPFVFWLHFWSFLRFPFKPHTKSAFFGLPGLGPGILLTPGLHGGAHFSSRTTRKSTFLLFAPSPRMAQTAQDRFKTASRSPRATQDGRRPPQDRPKMAARLPKSDPRPPQVNQRRPKTAPGLTQDGPKTVQGRPRTAPRRNKSAPRLPQAPQNGRRTRKDSP